MRLRIGIVAHPAIAELSPVSVPADAGLIYFWYKSAIIILLCQKKNE